jgi:hypothetical protein
MTKKSNAVTTAEVTGNINANRLIGRIGEMFSKGTTVVGELMQNARRAGATKVIIETDRTSKQMVVIDDGCGVEDFQKMITIAESDWSDEILESEDPFGIGFASAVFAAEKITVESRGKQISFTAADIVAQRAIPVQASGFIGGTRVTLTGLKQDMQRLELSFIGYARGFAIPVLHNGAELERPHALATLRGVDIQGIGFISHATLHQDVPELKTSSYRPVMYCQGLPVSEGKLRMRHAGYCGSTVVIHVDHHTWKPRIPDRDVLLDADLAEEQFEAAITAQMVQFLHQEQAALAPEEFAAKYWNLSKSLKVFGMMKDAVIPGSAHSTLEDYPVLSSHNDNCYTSGTAAITREDVESGKVVLCSPEGLANDDVANGFAKVMFAGAAGWAFVDQLPEGHWAQPYVIDLMTEKLHLRGKKVMEEFWCQSMSATIKLMDKLTLTMRETTVEMTKAFALGNENSDPVIMVPPGATASDALMQAYGYIDCDERYREEWLDEDIESINNRVAMLRGEAPGVTLGKVLNAGDISAKQNLRGTQFVVSIADDGKWTVTPHKPARVLITVSGGVADWVQDGDVDVELFDHDNFNDDPAETPKVRKEFADLALPINVPVAEQAGDEQD